MQSASPMIWTRVTVSISYNVEDYMYVCIYVCMFVPNRLGSPNIVVAKVLDCEIEVCKFEFQSHDRLHFWTNTLRKVMNPFNLLVELNSNMTVRLQGWLWH